MTSERAKDYMKKTGALVYWKNAADTATQIEADGVSLGKINALLK